MANLPPSADPLTALTEARDHVLNLLADTRSIVAFVYDSLSDHDRPGVVGHWFAWIGEELNLHRLSPIRAQLLTVRSEPLTFGEVSAESAHDVARELARRLWIELRSAVWERNPPSSPTLRIIHPIEEADELLATLEDRPDFEEWFAGIRDHLHRRCGWLIQALTPTGYEYLRSQIQMEHQRMRDRQPAAELTAEQKLIPPEPSSRLLPIEAIVEALGLPQSKFGAVEKVLARLHKDNAGVRTMVETPRKGEPHYVYRVPLVWPVLIDALPRWK